jgi:hypothetical protein
MKEIATALVAAQKEMGNAIKDSTNPFFKSKYADLNSVREACIPALNNHGIVVLQPIMQVEGKNFVKTILLHESGETMESLTEVLFAKQNDPQAQGSGITYARRYGLQSLVCIGAEDDDGNKAAEQPKARNASGLKSNGDLANGEDMKETLNKKNEYDFAGLKSIIESCASEEELKEVWTEKENAKIINSLKKWRPDLYQFLVGAANAMKASFKEGVKGE